MDKTLSFMLLQYVSSVEEVAGVCVVLVRYGPQAYNIFSDVLYKRRVYIIFSTT